jgi:hypothetical protein
MALGALETYLYPPPVLLKREAAYLYAPVRSRGGCGAAPSNHQELLPVGQEREEASKHTRRVRAKGLWAQRRSATPCVHHDRAQGSGGAHRDPVRPPARLLPSLKSGERGRVQTPPPVSTCHRPFGPAEEPRWSMPCPCHVFSLSGPETFGPQDGGGGTGAPRRTRPTGETHGRAACQQCHSASRPIPWRL